MTSTSMICSHDKGGENLTNRESERNEVVHYVTIELESLSKPCEVIYRVLFVIDEDDVLEVCDLEMVREEEVIDWVDIKNEHILQFDKECSDHNKVTFRTGEVNKLMEQTGIDTLDAMKIMSSIVTDATLMLIESTDI